MLLFATGSECFASAPGSSCPASDGAQPRTASRSASCFGSPACSAPGFVASSGLTRTSGNSIGKCPPKFAVDRGDSVT